METDILKKLEEQEKKIDAIYQSLEKLRKYFLVIIWITVLGVFFPLVGLLFATPSFLSTYSSLGGI